LDVKKMSTALFLIEDVITWLRAISYLEHAVKQYTSAPGNSNRFVAVMEEHILIDV
jgi:hypothetical protein